MSIESNLAKIKSALPPHVRLVAVSKTHPSEKVLEAYTTGQHIFGENKVQELVQKQSLLPPDIEWHLIGHLQTNKVKYIAPFVSLIHAVDSMKLLKEINKEAIKHKRVIDCLLQVKISEEESKFGMNKQEIESLLASQEFQEFHNVRIVGLMGMASLTEDQALIRKEFKSLKEFFNELKSKFFSESIYFKELSMGMSDDYPIAIEEGSTLIRLGSIIFGAR
jgi:pyridoxal phosphate enzyme (YggS family)